MESDWWCKGKEIAVLLPCPPEIAKNSENMRIEMLTRLLRHSIRSTTVLPIAAELEKYEIVYMIFTHLLNSGVLYIPNMYRINNTGQYYWLPLSLLFKPQTWNEVNVLMKPENIGIHNYNIWVEYNFENIFLDSQFFDSTFPWILDLGIISH